MTEAQSFQADKSAAYSVPNSAADGGGPCDFEADAIAAACLGAYRALPPKGAKPTRRSNSRLEWTILAGIVLSLSGQNLQEPSPCSSCPPLTASATRPSHVAISIATGLKCLPYDKLPPTGDVLHDSHAEVLARRGARRWLLARLEEEVIALGGTGDGNADAAQPCHTIFERNSIESRWRLKPDVKLHWYVSAMPCGDASTVLLDFQRAAQDEAAGRAAATTRLQLLDRHSSSADPAEGPSRTLSPTTAAVGSSSAFAGTPARGRAGLDRADSLRTKPGRPDSPPSISMSCSDKLALWNAVGIQGSLASSLLDPIYPDSIVIGHEALQQIFPTASAELDRLRAILSRRCKRALYGRLEEDAAGLPDAYRLRRPTIRWTSLRFDDSREAVEERARAEMEGETTRLASWAQCEPLPCAGSILFSPSTAVFAHPAGTAPHAALHENLVGGTKLGAPLKRRTPSQPLKPSTRSKVCKLDSFGDTMRIVARLLPHRLALPVGTTYWDCKQHLHGDEGVAAYRRAKAALLGPTAGPGRDEARVEAAVDHFISCRRNSAIGVERTEQDGEVLRRDDAGLEGALGSLGIDQVVPPFSTWLVTPSRFERFDLHGVPTIHHPAPT